MKIKKYIPDFITSLNLVCGVLGVVAVFEGRIDLAFPLMLAAGVFDFCDGLAARALGAYSDLGKELDSLSDLVSFGVLPAVMLYATMRACTWSASPLCLVPLLIAVFSGIRLAKFNVDPRQHASFLGLPTPACAILCASLSYYIAFEPASFLAQWAGGMVFIPALSVVLCALLVCEIPMFSLKFSRDDSATLKFKRIFLAVLCLAAVLVVVLCGLNWSLIAFLVFALYIVKNVIYWIFKV